MAEPIDNSEINNNGQSEKDLKPGVYVKSEKPIDANKATVEDFQNLNRVSERTGLTFKYDGANKTITPERMVIVPKKKQ